MTNNVVKLKLHPNTERATVVLAVKINKEQYCFSRKKEAKGAEKLLLTRAAAVVGIDKVQAGGEKLELEITPATNPSEWFPALLGVLKKYLKADAISVVLDDARWAEGPVWGHEDDWAPVKEGVRLKNANIGVPYTVFAIS